ncbi:hypothetical protein [Hyphomicrobium sp. MC8b]|uniref:hypothetical protein n=1 Tax=unclassified Hyphomicrobium TaxID=2619925 RepID=UPI0039189636
MLKISTLIAVLVVASTVASNAEAHGMGSFYASPFFRNQGRQPAQPCEKDKRRNLEEAFARAREKRLAELRAERAQAAALASKRARLAALAKKKAAAAKQAQTLAATRTKTIAQQTASTGTTNIAKKSDLLPVSTASNATATATKTAAAAPQVCRRYSAATDSVIEIPCD